MGNKIIMQRVRSLYGSTMDGLKMEKLNEGVFSLVGLDIKPIIIILNLVIHILSFKSDLILMPNITHWLIRYNP